MKVFEILETRFAFKKQGNKITRKYRCTSGPRKGQVRANPASCNAPLNIKRAHKLRQTKAKQGKTRAVKRGLTMKYNPTSRRVHQLNKSFSPPRRKKMR